MNMKVYIVWWLADVEAVFSSLKKASDYIDQRVDDLHKLSGYNLMSEFHIEEEEVR